MNAALLADLYEFRMLDSYLRLGMTAPAAFEFFVRRLPAERNFLVSCGLDDVLDFLARLRWSRGDIEWLARHCDLGPQAARYLSEARFDGEVHAMPEGTVFFADEPILRIVAPLPLAQVVESRVINILHFQTLIASKAARCRLAAGSRQLVDFGMRRAHAAEAGLFAARASFVGGFDGTSLVLAGKRYNIPLFGTMAHSYVQAHAQEVDAFRHFLAGSTEPTTLLVDTYDSARGVTRAARAAREHLAATGENRLRAIRLDSGDLATLAMESRRILDAEGLLETRIFCSGNLDEHHIAALLAAGAPIDGFGVGTRLTTSSDAPALDCAYKLQEYAGVPRRKRSSGKATWPGRRQVWRRLDANGQPASDTVTLDNERCAGEPLLRCVMRSGRRLGPRESLDETRTRTLQGIAALPDSLRRLDQHSAYEVTISDGLRDAARCCDQRFPD